MNVDMFFKDTVSKTLYTYNIINFSKSKLTSFMLVYPIPNSKV